MNLSAVETTKPTAKPPKPDALRGRFDSVSAAGDGLALPEGFSVALAPAFSPPAWMWPAVAAVVALYFFTRKK